MSDRDLLGREIEGLSKNRPARLYFLQWLQIVPELAFKFLILYSTIHILENTHIIMPYSDE